MKNLNLDKTDMQDFGKESGRVEYLQQLASRDNPVDIVNYYNGVLMDVVCELKSKKGKFNLIK